MVTKTNKKEKRKCKFCGKKFILSEPYFKTQEYITCSSSDCLDKLFEEIDKKYWRK